MISKDLVLHRTRRFFPIAMNISHCPHCSLCEASKKRSACWDYWIWINCVGGGWMASKAVNRTRELQLTVCIDVQQRVVTIEVKQSATTVVLKRS